MWSRDNKYVRIETLGLREGMLVVFKSDNGGARYAPYNRNDPFSGYKGSLWEGGIRKPCIVCWPGVLPAGKTTKQVAITMDWTVTFRRLAGLGQDSNKEDGIDLMPILMGDQPEGGRTLFWRIKSGPVRNVSLEYWVVSFHVRRITC